MEKDQSIEDRLNQLGGPVDNSHGSESVDSEPDENCDSLDPSVSQHVVRSHANGQDVLSGQFRVQLAAGQSVGVLHVPIYPPMETVPVVEAFGENESVRVRVTEAQRFGTRFELKVSPTEEARSEVITVVLTSR